MNKKPFRKKKLNAVCALTLVVVSFFSSCNKSAPRVDEGLEARSITETNPGKPTYEVLKGKKRVALVTFDWVTDTPGTGGAEWNWNEKGSNVTITLKDPDGVTVMVTLTDADGKLSASGAVDRAKIEMLSAEPLTTPNKAEQDGAQ